MKHQNIFGIITYVFYLTFLSTFILPKEKEYKIVFIKSLKDKFVVVVV